MKTAFTLTLALITSVGFGQTTGQIANYGGSNASSSYGSSAQLDALLGNVFERQEKSQAQMADIQGSPYTSDIFLPTQVYYKDENYGPLFYRYNAYNEEIEVKKDNSEGSGLSALGRDKNIAIIVEGKPMSFKTFIDKKGLTQNGYLILMAQGNYNFYKRVDVKFTEGQKAQNSFVKAIPARFSKFTEYYLEIPEKNRIDELELSNRKLIKLLPADKQVKTKAYLKENGIKIKDESDVIKVLSWLNQQ